ncbi:hypothetical protein [Shewanella glacialipiscicola]|uniref:hypothetical protein n=1 Tax=Shewanella glacialipiscicola TaxID=614069 RepID=UPI003D7A0D34
MTTSKTALITVDAVTVETSTVDTSAQNKQSKPKQVSDKSIIQGFITQASDFMLTRDSIEASRIAELKLTEDASRKDKLGMNGMKAECHAKANAYLSGMTPAALAVFKELKIDAKQMASTPEAGGMSREHKRMTITICESIAQKRLPANLDLSKATEAAKKIDPKFAAMTRGHNSIALLIETIKLKNHFSVNYWTQECNGATQANYVMGLIAKLGLGKVTGSKEARTASIDTDHAIIEALINL